MNYELIASLWGQSPWSICIQRKREPRTSLERQRDARRPGALSLTEMHL